MQKLSFFFAVIGMAAAVYGASVDNPRTEAPAATFLEQVGNYPGLRGLLLPVGQDPSEIESEVLLRILQDRSPGWEGRFEEYLSSESPWSDSARSCYALICKKSGRFTPALEHWRKTWERTRAYSSGSRKVIADFALVNWVQLLASLGRKDELKAIFEETTGRIFIYPDWQAQFDKSREAYWIMVSYPQVAYRCGTLALKNVARALGNTNRVIEGLIGIPSEVGGFTMTQLKDFSDRYGLGLVPVRRNPTDELVVPCVVHWQLDHYAAIIQRRDSMYLVVDPTFGDSRWISQAVIDSEASGAFMVPAGEVPQSWHVLGRQETDRVFGQGYANNIKDNEDEGCRKSPGSKSDCPPCAKGMPQWWVSEPYVNLWVGDEPLAYTASRGDVTFRVNYKQRESTPTLGTYVPRTTWNHSWFSYIHAKSSEAYYNFPLFGPPAYYGWTATLFLPGGGERTYSMWGGQDHEPSRTRLETVTGACCPSEGSYIYSGFRLIHPDGSQDIYGKAARNAYWPDGTFPENDFLLTEHIDQFGNTNRFEYEVVGVVYRLKYMIDYDGRTNTLSYTNNNLVSAVSDPYGRTALFRYDSNQQLTNIVDVLGITNAIQYSDKGYVTNLITPYGSTGFNYTEAATNTSLGNLGGHQVNRAVQVTEANGSKQLYLFRFDCTYLTPSTYATNEVPSGTPIGTVDNGTDTNIFSTLDLHNSVYWNRKQYSALSTEDVSALTDNDYRKGRLQHWLQDSNDLVTTEILSMEREPSTESTGASEGQKTFYDYPGKAGTSREGFESLPGVIARVLPNGQTEYMWRRYNKHGFPTNIVTTYSRADGTVGTRTNTLVFEGNTTWQVFSQGGSNSWTVYNLLTKMTNWNGDLQASFGYETNTTGKIGTDNLGNPLNTTTTSRRVVPSQLTNAVGDVTSIMYGEGTTVKNIQTAGGLTVTNRFVSRAATNSISLQIGRTNNITYSNGLVYMFEDELGLRTTNTWDTLQRLTSTRYPDGTYTSNLYDTLDLVGARDRMGKWKYFLYNSVRQLVAETNELGNVTRYGYGTCGCGQLETITNALGQVTTITYDNQLRPTAVSYPDGSSIARAYNLIGQVTSVTDGAGRSVSYGYSHQGLVTNVSNAAGILSAMTYDILDRPSAVTDAQGVTVTNTFDKLHRVVAAAYPDGGIERFGYSAPGLVAYTNQLGIATKYQYDPAERLITITNAASEVLQFAYNPAGGLTNLLDGRSQHTRWKYDQYGRMTNKIDDLGNSVLSLAYDANGRVTARTTPAKGTTSFSYDDGGNLTGVDYPTSPDLTFGYDKLNRLSNMVDAVGSTAFGYTAVGQLASEDGPWSLDTVTYTYGERLRSNLTLEQPNGGGWAQSYTYDSSRRLGTLTSPSGSFGYDYDGRGSLSRKVTLPNGSYITNAYDAVKQLTGTWLKTSTNTVLDYAGYAYDLQGRRTNAFRTDSSKVVYDYTAIDQLKTANGYESNGTVRINEKLGYAYDAAHNLQRRTNNALVQTFNTDSLNELSTVTRTDSITVSGTTLSPATSVTVNGQAATVYGDATFAREGITVISGTNSIVATASDSYGRTDSTTNVVYLPASITYQYDANGNLTNDGTRAFFYDDENQLTSVVGAGAYKSDFVYDGLGRRRIRREYSWKGAGWSQTNEVRYIYDGNLPIQERDANNYVQVSYTRGLDLSGRLQGAGGIGGLLSRKDASSSAFYHADGAGNVTALINTSETPVAQYCYDPYGNVLGMSGPLAEANTYRFSSKELHKNSGTYHYGFRAYDPNLQRWVNQDPIDEAGGINLFAFLDSNPVGRLDPFGLDDTARGMLLQELGETEVQRKAQGWRKDFVDTANLGLSLTPQDDFSRAVLGESLSGEKVGGLERAAAGAGLAAGLFGKAKKCLTAAKDWWKARKAKKAADKLRSVIPKIMGHTGELRSPEIIDRIKADMLAGRYRFDSPEGIIAGIEDASGTIHLTEGQHRMNAAMEILEETGNPEFVNRLIDSARQGTDGRSFLIKGDAPAGSVPLPRR